MPDPYEVELPEPDALVDEQIDYYRARAPEYDDWWLRTGRYTPDEEFGRRWEQGKRDLQQAVADFGAAGDVLEIAAGTGNLTIEVCRTAAHVTAVDASPEALAIARTKTEGHDVAFLAVDVFSWEPPRRFDAVVFGFWLSHVPRRRMQQFWSLVDAALRPNGRVFFVDNAVPVEQAAGDGADTTPWSRTWLDRGVSVRTLSDGRRFRIVKRGWAPEELEAELATLGWRATVAVSQGLFIHGTACAGERPA